MFYGADHRLNCPGLRFNTANHAVIILTFEFIWARPVLRQILRLKHHQIQLIAGWIKDQTRIIQISAPARFDQTPAEPTGSPCPFKSIELRVIDPPGCQCLRYSQTGIRSMCGRRFSHAAPPDQHLGPLLIVPHARLQVPLSSAAS